MNIMVSIMMIRSFNLSWPSIHQLGPICLAKFQEFLYGGFINSPKAVPSLEFLNPPLHLSIHK